MPLIVDVILFAFACFLAGFFFGFLVGSIEPPEYVEE